ncbi:hypothetical protein [Chitinilyticum piscinae]|uniref:Uncharacterized protein n=1 Tax=Chitinilyticum piscinae TaxID=2866724 RepID=A0A8J7KE14_9NEIS|nr:hypothetical protein [Chitinilyticum piscinae]MBE9609054.1 hypothetical protein [Chitinilyticum piscinae]
MLHLSGCSNSPGSPCESNDTSLCLMGDMVAMAALVPVKQLADAQEKAARGAIQGPPRPTRLESFTALVHESNTGDLAAQRVCVERCYLDSRELNQADVGYAAQQYAAQQLLQQAEREPGSVDELSQALACLHLASEPAAEGRALLHPDMIRRGWALARAWTPEQRQQFSGRNSVHYVHEYQQQLAGAMFQLYVRSQPAERQWAVWQGCVSNPALPEPGITPAGWSRVEVCMNAWRFGASPRSIENGVRYIPRELGAQWLSDEARMARVPQ